MMTTNHAAACAGVDTLAARGEGGEALTGDVRACAASVCHDHLSKIESNELSQSMQNKRTSRDEGRALVDSALAYAALVCRGHL